MSVQFSVHDGTRDFHSVSIPCFINSDNYVKHQLLKNIYVIVCPCDLEYTVVKTVIFVLFCFHSIAYVYLLDKPCYSLVGKVY